MEASIKAIIEKTGKPIDELRATAPTQTFTRHPDAVTWAWTELGLRHGYVCRLAGCLKVGADVGTDASDAYVSLARPGLRRRTGIWPI